MTKADMVAQPDSSASATTAVDHRLAGLILAAGRASRMGRDKRLVPVDGIAMLERAVRAAIDGGLDPVLVVTGPDDPVALPPEVIRVVNPDPGRGMGSSLAAGIVALAAEIDGVVVLLADMPRVGAGHVAALAAAFAPQGGGQVCVPVCRGRRGNPVLLGRAVFAALAALTGDVGARTIINQNPDMVVEVALDEAVLIDIDTAQDLATVEGRS